MLVERSSRLVLLAHMEDATAASALAGFTVKLNSIAAPMRHSFTYDQGKEMSRHQQLALNTGVRAYFCDPHRSWQRGTCENTNGLLRQYLPKDTDLSVYGQKELDAIGRQHEQPASCHARLQHPAGRLLSPARYGSAASNFNSITECCAWDLKPPT